MTGIEDIHQKSASNFFFLSQPWVLVILLNYRNFKRVFLMLPRPSI